jgi:hypothetical protein
MRKPIKNTSIVPTSYWLAATLRAKLAEMDGGTTTDEGVEKWGIVTFMAEQADVTTIKLVLAAEGINVTTPRGSGVWSLFSQLFVKIFLNL